MAKKINHLIEAYRKLNPHSENIVLATIIETFGSTYQKAGASMLIAKDSKLTGLLGGGCFEIDLVEHAQSVFKTEKAKTVFYDMRSPDDVIWGLGLGCNGAVRILLQLLKAGDDFSPLNTLAEAADTCSTGVLMTICESGHPDFPAGSHVFLPTITPDTPQSPAVIPSPFFSLAQHTFLQRKPRIENQNIDGHLIKVFYNPVQPPPQLLLVGAGADALPVVQCAKALGWRVTLVDHRPGHIQKERFSQADQLLYILPQELSAQLELDQFSAMVLMTHSIEFDERYLKVLAKSHIPYVGLLGPAPRKDRLLQSLGAASRQIKDRVFGPVGLDIGAETPEEIALSIMAGIYAAMNGREGRQLSPEASTDLNNHTHEFIN